MPLKIAAPAPGNRGQCDSLRVEYKIPVLASMLCRRNSGRTPPPLPPRREQAWLETHQLFLPYFFAPAPSQRRARFSTSQSAGAGNWREACAAAAGAARDLLPRSSYMERLPAPCTRQGPASRGLRPA